MTCIGKVSVLKTFYKYWIFICILWYFCHNITAGMMKGWKERHLKWCRTYFSLLCLDQFRSIQPISHVQLFATPWTAARQTSLSITNSRSLFKLMSIETMMTSKNLVLCCPLLFLPSISQHQGLFKWVSSSHQVTKALEFQLQYQSFHRVIKTDFL